MKMILAGKDCADCVYSVFYHRVLPDGTSRDKSYCFARNKEYFYGQCIPCEDKEKR